MKLWPIPSNFIRNKANDAQWNAWQAMRQRSKDTFRTKEKCDVYSKISTPQRRECALLDYDKWILKKILYLKQLGLHQPAAKPASSSNLPTSLASIGKSQKLLNVYIKHQFCWQFLKSANYTHTNISSVDFLCALHAPIDAFLLKAICQLPIGQWLNHQYSMIQRASQSSPIIRQSDNSWKPWSKLDCLRTYYGFQLVLRRIAIATWPSGCICSDISNGIYWFEECVKMFKEEFSKNKKCDGPDWIEIAKNIPADVITKTIDSI